MALPRRRTPGRDEERPAGAPGAEPDWRALYEIDNPAEVDAYVAEHPTLVPILGEAPDQIHAVFGTAGPPKLSVEWDPEEGDCWLFVGIPSDDVGPSVLPLIYAFEELWWLDRMPATDAVVAFDVVQR
jgi:hypothetical protein